jgi:hypothetical protein
VRCEPCHFQSTSCKNLGESLTARLDGIAAELRQYRHREQPQIYDSCAGHGCGFRKLGAGATCFGVRAGFTNYVSLLTSAQQWELRTYLSFISSFKAVIRRRCAEFSVASDRKPAIRPALVFS